MRALTVGEEKEEEEGEEGDSDQGEEKRRGKREIAEIENNTVHTHTHTQFTHTHTHTHTHTTPSPALKMSSGNSTMWKMLETADTASGVTVSIVPRKVANPTVDSMAGKKEMPRHRK